MSSRTSAGLPVTGKERQRDMRVEKVEVGLGSSFLTITAFAHYLGQNLPQACQPQIGSLASRRYENQSARLSHLPPQFFGLGR